MLGYDHSPIRAACDSCHARKIRCVKNMGSQCRSCRENDRVCKFSPRLTMGRPRNWQNYDDTFSSTISRIPETLENLDDMSYNETRDTPRFV